MDETKVGVAAAEARSTGVAPAPAGAMARVEARHHAGQTFVTFTEAADAPGARYRVYRTAKAPVPADLTDATRLETLPAGSGRALTDRWVNREGRWDTRYLERWVAESGRGPLPADQGLFVFTLHAEDLGGKPEAQAFYAVTRALPGEGEVMLAASGAVTERVAPTEAVRALSSADARGHVYVQFMDRRRWNPTFHAPRPGNDFLGLDAKSPAIKDSLAYAYTYLVSEPDPASCGGTVPESLPVFFTLHGWGGASYKDPLGATPYFCALQITPTDFGETWYFGFAAKHDYRAPGPLADDDVIVNFTEQRLLRMLDDLTRDPALGARVDLDRVYVWGHSMGGTGALALATRYPEVFAAAYASQPVTHPAENGRWVQDVTPKWGTAAQRLPIRLQTPDGRPAALARYDATPVFEWQHHPAQIKARLADEMAPFGISHGRSDTVLAWATQGRPAYADFDAGRRAWGGQVTDAEHTWAAFAGLPPSLEGDRSLAPFQGFKVRRSETVPGLSASSGNGTLPPPDAPAPAPTYNTNLRWASSWDPWDAPPVDEPARWCMSLRTTDERTVTVEVTPRRAQRFKAAPGSKWRAVSTPVGGGAPQTQPVQARPEGLLVVPTTVTPKGVRLCLEPG